MRDSAWMCAETRRAPGANPRRPALDSGYALGVRALAVPIAVVVAVSLIGAVVDSRYWFGDNVLVVVLLLACVLAVVNTWEFWASARGGRRPRAARTPTTRVRPTGESAGE
jgi:hypothetical protein